MNYEYALGAKKMQEDLEQDARKDANKADSVITLDNYQACQRYFHIMDFWNKQIRKGMGWE